ncbi:MAG TPA: phosphoribosylglycinamide formyltransferase [Nitratifractor sp.]|jgi:phosphoribosylglycinamide formyltransferase-1|nr:phosphoribosylglycinamide formyltransferase [Nitratifractor sp.]
MKRIAVLFSGEGTNFNYILKQLHKKGLEVTLAITNNPKAGGIAYAKKFNVPLKVIDSSGYSSREAFDAALVEELTKYQLDLVVLAGFMRILTAVFTEKIDAINLHPSLLPRHKGMHAIEKSYADEYSEGGVTVHKVTSELDGGEIVLQKAIEKGKMSFDEYYDRVKSIEKLALVEAIERVLE